MRSPVIMALGLSVCACVTAYGETIELTAEIADGPNGMLIEVSATGLAEGYHGTHLHKIADCSDPDAGFMRSGGHINPENKPHGFLNPDGYKVANLPNLWAHKDGTAKAQFFLPGVKRADIMDDDGFAIIVHRNRDDHKSQPIGGTGQRIGCIAIGDN